ncbi:hypothetical protein ACUXVY_12895 [Chromobacterium haemolyticum]|uniref:hypothetical protein n=1 Tax=Chromobacterium haemolyticum TaxID=394935 RepID=UPI00405779A0
MADKKDSPAFELVVKHAFADFDIGDVIKDEVKIAEILNGETAAYVLKRQPSAG